MKKIKLDQYLNKPSLLSEKFHDMTKWRYAGSEFLPVEKWPKAWGTTFFKDYPRFDKVILPEPSNLEEIQLKDVLYNRRSTRAFSKQPLSLEQISDLLFYSAGMRHNNFPWIGNRFYPSPGGRYTLEVYL